MDRYIHLLYTSYILIIIMIIVFFVSVFNDNDYKLGFFNYVDSYVNNKCYPIRKTPQPVINDLYDIMYSFDKSCIDNKVEYFACAGTLLGAVRHNKIIPWDDDLDVILNINERDRLTNIIFPELIKRGFKIERGNITNNYRVLKNNTTYPFMDVFFYKDYDKYIIPHSMYYGLIYPKEVYLKKSIIYPLKRYTLGNIQIQGPNDAVKYLKQIYGRKVMSEVAGTFFDHNTFKVYKLCKIKLKDIKPEDK